MAADPILPALGFHFLVEFSFNTPKIDMHFMEVSGLEANLEVETYAEGGENRFSYQLPLRTKFNNLVLKRGLASDGSESELLKWAHDAIYDFVVAPATVTVKLLQRDPKDSSAPDKATPLKVWTFAGAYPVKVTHAGLNAMQGELVIETLELTYAYARP